MREPKFRAWDKVTERYYAVDSLVYDDDGNLCEVYLAGIQINESNPNANVRLPNEVVLEQYTGLKDKNGKEIYEGDVVDDGYSNICEIRWSEKLAGFKAVDEKDGYATNVWLVSEYGKVIGNVHENPELLKEEK